MLQKNSKIHIPLTDKTGQGEHSELGDALSTSRFLICEKTRKISHIVIDKCKGTVLQNFENAIFCASVIITFLYIYIMRIFSGFR